MRDDRKLSFFWGEMDHPWHSGLSNRGLVEEACLRFPERVILGIDAKGGKVAIRGWSEVISLEARELARQFEGMGLSAIIFTDVERDGMGTGLNTEATKALARSTSIPVIASGGVSRIEDIQNLMALEPDGVIGVIVGRALYTGQLDLEEAIRLTKNDGEIGRQGDRENKKRIGRMNK